MSASLRPWAALAMVPSMSAQSMRADKPILLYTSSAPVPESPEAITPD